MEDERIVIPSKESRKLEELERAVTLAVATQASEQAETNTTLLELLEFIAGGR